MSAITVYKAKDGTLFQTKEQQELHDVHQANKVLIEEFLDKYFPVPPALELPDGTKKYRQAAGRGPARRAIIQWIKDHLDSKITQPTQEDKES